MVDSSFPAALYAESVLAVNFRDAQTHFLEFLLQIHRAHTLMLERQAIIPSEAARLCLEALDKLDHATLAGAPYDGRTEDLFFYIEQALAEACGAENAGRMHTARSRNDIDITLYRMRLRRQILELAGALSAARGTLLKLAGEHVMTVMPAYTHTQPAQPITFAHYLLAVVEIMGRDGVRLQAAFKTVNRSPMGACAIATTGFPIDRFLTSHLLGFEGLQLNSYGAIAATDYLTETGGAVATAMVNLGRVAQDLLLWCTAEFGYLRLSDAWVQISSIMPQKRNPVPLEHTRALASKSLAQAQGILTALHNTPFGDINDAEDDIQPLVHGAMSDAVRAVRILAGAMADCEVRRERMAERAHSDFLTVTELADTLVRREGMSFREAHHLVSLAVRELKGHYTEAGMVDAILKLGGPLTSAREDLLQSLDPANFVAVRNVPGGPSPDTVRSAIELAQADLKQAEVWLCGRQANLDNYPQRMCEAALRIGRA